MSLEQLDAFLQYSKTVGDLQCRLNNRAQPIEMSELLSLAKEHGFEVEEADVLAAQLRAEQSLSDAELQRRAGEEARRLRHFIYG